MSVANLNKYLTQGAVEGFGALIAPVSAFAYNVKLGASSVNDVVRVAYATNNSGSSVFSYATGYTGDSNGVVGKSITLDTLLYQPIKLTDSDLLQMSEEALVSIGRQAGQTLASDFLSASFAATLTQANFANSGSADAAQYSGSAALAALDKAVNDLKWPDGERTIIAGTTLWQAFMQNSTIVNAANFGNVSAVQQGKLNSVLGFAPYKTTIALPNSAKGFASSKNGLLIGNGYHAPQDMTGLIAADQIIEPTSGLTFGFRHIADPLKATTYRIFDILGGSAVGNPNGIYWIK